MTEDGIHLHVTTKGKLLLVARKAEQSITFQLSLPEARELCSTMQSQTYELSTVVGDDV